MTGTPVVGSTTSSSESANAIPCRTPPSTWLDAVSGLTIRPTSCTATIRSTRTSPSAGVDRDLRDLAAERVDDEAVRVRAARAGAVDRRVAELLGHLGHVGVDRAVVRADPAVAHLEVAGGDLEDVARELEQRLAHLRRGRAHGRHHRRRRLRAARDRAVDVVARVAADDADVVERQPELLGRDDLRAGQRAGADVLDARSRRARGLRRRGGRSRATAGRRRPTRSASRSPSRAGGRRALRLAQLARARPSPRARRRGRSRRAAACSSTAGR